MLETINEMNETEKNKLGNQIYLRVTRGIFLLDMYCDVLRQTLIEELGFDSTSAQKWLPVRPRVKYEDCTEQKLNDLRYTLGAMKELSDKIDVWKSQNELLPQNERCCFEDYVNEFKYQTPGQLCGGMKLC